MGGLVDKRIRPGVLRNDAKVLAAVADIAGYAPGDPAFTVAAVESLSEKMTAARAREAQANAAAAAARDNAERAERDFHGAVLRMKACVTAQFGDNSNEHQAIGLKKKSERKNPGPKPGWKKVAAKTAA